MSETLSSEKNQASQALRGAVAEIVRRISETLPDIREPIRMYIAGGIAVNFYTGYRATEDLDATFSRRLMLPPANDLVVGYTDDQGQQQTIFLDMNDNPTFGLMHPDAEDDAIELLGEEFNNPKIQLYVLSPVDLAVSKISRWEGNDQEDVAELAKRKLFTSKELELRANQALEYYVGSDRMVRLNLAEAVSKTNVLQKDRTHGLSLR